MRRRHPLPTLWLMTDERQGDRLWPALRALPRGSGVIVRHHSLTGKEQRALIARIRAIAKARRLTLVVAGPARIARAARADGFHARSARIGPRDLLRTVAVHDALELQLAHRAVADLIFVSPVFPTASHPDGRSLGRAGLGRLALRSRIPVIALGGMNARRARSLRRLGIYGWAAIGALTPVQS